MDSIAIANAKSLADFECDYMPPKSVYQLFTASGTPYKVTLHTPTTLSGEELTVLQSLIEKTSGQHYKASAQGWNSRRKKKEMRLVDLKYLVVRSQDEGMEKNGQGEKKILGFASFMPTYEDGIRVIYVYEIHLEKELRGTGLAQNLMSIIESVAKKIEGVEKIMLTCFTANEGAFKFYRKLGYEKDEFSPEPRVMRGGRRVECDYVILSKGI